MAFHDILLPDGFQYQSVAGPGFGTVIQESASGHEYRVARQAQGRHRFRLVKSLQTEAEAKALKAFALARRGALHSWKLKDFSDYTSNADGITTPTNLDQIIAVGDGTEDTFNLTKAYTSGDASYTYTRPITLPVSGTVVVAVDGSDTTDFTINAEGQIVLDTPPPDGDVVTAGFQFHVPVRFAKAFDEWAQLQADAYQLWSLPSLDAIEVLSEVELPERWSAGGGTEWGSVASDIRVSMNNGAMQQMTTTAAINVFLPPVSRIPSGDRVFTFSLTTGSSNDIQLRDEEGNTVGAAFGSGGAVRRVGLSHDSSGDATWVLY